MKHFWKSLPKKWFALLSILAGGWRLYGKPENPAYHSTQLLLKYCILVFVPIIIVIWVVVCRDDLRSMYRAIREYLLRISPVAPKITIFYICAGVSLCLAAGALGRTVWLDYTQKKLASPPSLHSSQLPHVSTAKNNTNFETVSLNIQADRCFQITNLMVALIPISSQQHIARAEVPDLTGHVRFFNIQAGNYCALIVTQNNRHGFNIHTFIIDLKLGQTEFNCPMHSMQAAKIFCELNGFQMGDTKIRTEHEAQLSKFTSQIYGRHLVIVFGYTDARGKDGYNEGLAFDRATSVADDSSFAHIPKSDLYCFTIWARMPAVPNLKRGTPQNRRVVCLVIDI